MVLVATRPDPTPDLVRGRFFFFRVAVFKKVCESVRSIDVIRGPGGAGRFSEITETAPSATWRATMDAGPDPCMGLA